MNVEAQPSEEVPKKPVDDDLDELKSYTVADVAAVFQVTPYTVRGWLNAEDGLRGFKVGSGKRGCWRVTKKEMVRFANDRFGSDLPNE